jgi:hypothetical protein
MQVLVKATAVYPLPEFPSNLAEMIADELAARLRAYGLTAVSIFVGEPPNPGGTPAIEK